MEPKISVISCAGKDEDKDIFQPLNELKVRVQFGFTGREDTSVITIW